MTKRISELPAVTLPLVTDQFEVNQGGTSKRATIAQIGTLFPAGPPGPPGSSSLGYLNVMDFGALGTGFGHDDTAAFQAAVAACPENGTIYVPAAPRFFYITAGLQPAGAKCVNWLGNRGGGDVAGGTLSMGSTIVGSLSVPLIKTVGDYRFSGPQIRGLNLVQIGTGDGLYIENWTGPEVCSCSVSLSQPVGTGIHMAGAIFGAYIEHPIIVGGAIGILASSHVDILTCDVTGCVIGVQLSGTESNIRGGRLEVNGTAIKCVSLSRASVSGVSMEANDIGLHVVSAISCHFSAIGMEGSTNAPSGSSNYGVYMEYAQGVCCDSIGAGGTYTTTAIHLPDSANVGAQTSWRGCLGTSAASPSWRIPVGYVPTHGEFVQCNNP